MFNNEHGSEAFETFLGLLGDRVPLRGYQGYTAQLDTTQDLDGTHMIRRRLRGTDIVFHVSTYLHYDENDQQQVPLVVVVLLVVVPLAVVPLVVVPLVVVPLVVCIHVGGLIDESLPATAMRESD